MKIQAIVAAACMLLSTGAFAQDSTTDSTATPPPAPAETAPAAEAVVTQKQHPVRVRWGLDASIGWFFPMNALSFGGSARLGAQITDLIGVYLDGGYTAGVGIGGAFSGSGGSLSISALSFWHLAPMVELDFGKFFIGAGPVFAGGGWGQVTQGVDSGGNVTQEAVAVGGFLPGVDARLGITFGDRFPGTGFLGGFTLAIDVKALNGVATSVSQSGGSTGGSQAIQVGDRVWGVATLLTLGYNAR